MVKQLNNSRRRYVPVVLMLRCVVVVLGSLWLALMAQADTRYTVYLSDQSEHRVAIARLTVQAQNQDQGYQLELIDSAFDDYFLSMRPFKCALKQDNMLCYVAYPYQNRRHISRQDLTDLEYDLLFNARTDKEYGINPWNGRYFRLHWEGERILGELHEVDLNLLASPPEDGNLRPITAAELTPAAPGAKWLPRLIIEPAAD